jgi:hypothetical protein
MTTLEKTETIIKKGVRLPERSGALNIAAHAVYPDQFAFQVHHAIGNVLNIGCNTDGAKFHERDGINVDLYDVDPNNGNVLPVHVIADARYLPDSLYGRFDTVVLGEILEHMEEVDAVKTLEQASKCLNYETNARIVITMPHDGRRDHGTLDIPERAEYAEGIHAFHYRKIEREELMDWLKQAGLQPILCAEIRYPWDGVVGSGVVAVSL